MSITNMTLPDLIAGIDNTSEFGAMEKRLSHYGALNAFYNNAKKLFGEALIAQIKAQPFTRTIRIPIFDKYDHTVLTVRSCDINCQDINSRLKALTRTHLAIDICINPSDYDNNYVQMQQALKHRYLMAKKAVYKNLDVMAASFLDLNKDTSMIADPVGGPYANPLYKSKTGAIEVASSVKFYAYVATIMEQYDLHGPFLDIANTIANAETNILQNPGNGNVLQTDRLLAGANIAEYEFSNRIAAGILTPVHYLAPTGSIGVLNMIDKVYRDKPLIGSADDFAQWDRYKDLTEIKLWGQTPDEVFNDWDWGVLQEKACVNETILYKTKFSADWVYACDFTSVAGESPIKRIDITALA